MKSWQAAVIAATCTGAGILIGKVLPERKRPSPKTKVVDYSAMAVEEARRRREERESADRYREHMKKVRSELEARRARGERLTPTEEETLGYFVSSSGRRIYYDCGEM